MLVQPHLAAAPQDPRRLGERARLLRHHAQHQREDHRVSLAVAQRERVAMPSDHLYSHGRRGRRGGRGLAHRGVRLDRDDLRHLGRVQREVRAVPGADFHDTPG